MKKKKKIKVIIKNFHLMTLQTHNILNFLWNKLSTIKWLVVFKKNEYFLVDCKPTTISFRKVSNFKA